MRLILEVKVLGYDPVPWSVPVVTRSGGTYRPRKTRLAAMSLSLADWQKLVRDEVMKEFFLGDHGADHAAFVDRCVTPERRPVILHVTFLKKTPPGRRDGDPWFTGVTWNEKKRKWVKEGNHEPDLTNLEKALEDALEGAAIANDYQVVRKACQRVYGPRPGAVIAIYLAEAGDFPATGEVARPLPKPRRLKRCKTTPPEGPVRGEGSAPRTTPCSSPSGATTDSSPAPRLL